MARNTNITKCTDPIVKLQAFVRGYLVRNRFAHLKQEYNEIVKCIEGDSAKVRWKNDSKLCLPSVDHESSPTPGVLTDNGQQKNTSETTDLSLQNKLNISNLLDKTTPVHACVDETIKITDNCANEAQDMSMPDGDFESTSKANNSMARVGKSTKEITSKNSVNLNGSDLNSTSNPAATNLNTAPVKSCGSQTSNNTETAQEIPNHAAANEKGRTESVDERNCCSSNEGTDSELHQTLYPNDKLLLLKLREDLAMELLWIEQAIESRINYLTMKENMEEGKHH